MGVGLGEAGLGLDKTGGVMHVPAHWSVRVHRWTGDGVSAALRTLAEDGGHSPRGREDLGGEAGRSLRTRLSRDFTRQAGGGLLRHSWAADAHRGKGDGPSCQLSP